MKQNMVFWGTIVIRRRSVTICEILQILEVEPKISSSLTLQHFEEKQENMED